MLTAQARYQDPLEPVSSSDYSAQLAQFSMVEQQVLTNELMQGLVDELGSSGTFDPLTWFGKDVLVETPFEFTGNPVTIDANPPFGADSMVLKVTDANGNTVLERELSVASGPVIWEGLDDDSNWVAPGTYSVVVESMSRGQIVSTDRNMVYQSVVETRDQGGQTLLVLDNGQTVATTDVVGLRETTDTPSQPQSYANASENYGSLQSYDNER
jgi:flagellar basal-body rod modification protein FlgD